MSEISDSKWSSQVSQLRESIKEKDSTIEDLQRELLEYQNEQRELEEQNRWKEVQLMQQIELGEQRIASLKEECLSLKGKVRDLKVYCAALRRGDSSSRPPSRISISEDEPLSLEAEELSLSGSWRDARMSLSQPKRFRRTSGSSIDKSPWDQSLNSSFDLGLPSSPSTARQSSSRPGSVILPPINLTQSVGRPQFRQHMRFSSAPAVNSNRAASRRRASEVNVVKKKQAD